jgi:hypothetical protein
MIHLYILSMLAGGVLGMRLKVLSLVPAIGVAFIAIVGIGFVRGDHLGSVILAMVLAATSLQMGYLAASVARFSFVALRAPRRRSIGTPTDTTRPVHRRTVQA